MSLVVLFVIEFGCWIAFNRAAPFSIPRTTVAMGTTTGAAIMATLYFATCEATNQIPAFIDPMLLLMYALANAILTLGIALVSFTHRVNKV